MYRFLQSSSTTNPIAIDAIKFIVRDFSTISKGNSLTNDQLALLFKIHQLNEWNITTNSISCQYLFQTFKDTFAFMSSVSSICDQMDHYPKWINKNSSVKVEINTPQIGITIKDVFLAYTMDSIHKDIEKNNVEYIAQLSKLSTSSIIQNSWNDNYLKIETQITQQVDKNVNQLI